MFENDYQRHSEGLLFSLRHFVVRRKHANKTLKHGKTIVFRFASFPCLTCHNHLSSIPDSVTSDVLLIMESIFKFSNLK